MKFSLIIPVAPERDAPIIQSLKEINYPKSEFHVIVVKGENPSENRNKGVERAKAGIIGFLDDDALVDKDILENVENFFQKHPEIDIVGGPQLTPFEDTGFAKVSGYALSSKFGAWNVSNRYKTNKENLNVNETSLTSANLFVRKDVMNKIRFDSKLFPGEDPKFISDAKDSGFRVAYSPNIIIYHNRRSTINSFIKQIFKYGKVRPKKETFRETLKMPSFLIPSLFVIYLMILIVLEIGNITLTGNVINNINEINPINYLLIIPLLIYILLSFIFSIYDSSRNKDLKAIFILPFIYLIIHLSYGLGMIWGYIKKLK